ncbi:MAG: beta-ketoacyl synthase N-terminal-like domain-containing protein, partial [Lysobacter spongiicola]|nr:beta-ketoacyl synthase N-terminal-like domain-containing protein [Lysobacter spongiicola]
MAAINAAGGGSRRVVVTGMGVVSCIGNAAASVTESLRKLRAGIRFVPEYAEMGLRSHVAG